jgi:hypothetical protein
VAPWWRTAPRPKRATTAAIGLISSCS